MVATDIHGDIEQKTWFTFILWVYEDSGLLQCVYCWEPAINTAASYTSCFWLSDSSSCSLKKLITLEGVQCFSKVLHVAGFSYMPPTCTWILHSSCNADISMWLLQLVRQLHNLLLKAGEFSLAACAKQNIIQLYLMISMICQCGLQIQGWFITSWTE